MFGFVTESHSMVHGKMKLPGSGGGGGSKVNVGDAKLQFTKLFAQALYDYAKAQQALFLAYGKKDLADRAAQVANFNTDAKKAENNIAKSVDIVTKNNTEAEALLKGANVKFSAEAAAQILLWMHQSPAAASPDDDVWMSSWLEEGPPSCWCC